VSHAGAPDSLVLLALQKDALPHGAPKVQEQQVVLPLLPAVLVHAAVDDRRVAGSLGVELDLLQQDSTAPSVRAPGSVLHSVPPVGLPASAKGSWGKPAVNRPTGGDTAALAHAHATV
jgi:hypothetical protein